MLPCPPHLPDHLGAPGSPGQADQANDSAAGMAVDEVGPSGVSSRTISATSASSPTLQGDSELEEAGQAGDPKVGQDALRGEGVRMNARKRAELVPGRKGQYRKRAFHERQEHVVWRGNEKVPQDGQGGTLS